MKVYKYFFHIFISVTILTSISSCTKDIENLNIDTKQVTTAKPVVFFTYSMKSIADLMSAVNYPANGPQVIINVWRLYSQYYTQVQGGLDDSKYFLTQSQAPIQIWRILYSDILNNLDKAQIGIEENLSPGGSASGISKNELAIIEIMKVFTFSILVETFGDIPYSEALNIQNVLPKYDNQKDIYLDLLDRLTSAISSLDNSASSFGSADPYFSGNVSKWKKFGNSLKLRMGLRIADILPNKSSEVVNEALLGGVMTSNDDSFIFRYLPTTPNTNLLWRSLVESGQHYYIPSKTLVDSMNKFNDPRRDIYFTRYQGGFVGGQYGLSISYASVSHIGDYFMKPDLPQVIFDYSSVEFLLAEAAERSIYGSPADAEDHYNKAVRASMLYYGVSSTEIDNYLNQNSVKYSTADGSWKQKIGVQKWIAGYNQGVETWTEYRRLDYPILIAPVDAFVNIVPTRFTYPLAEQTLNAENYQKAATSIGGDLLTTKLFWDTY